MAECALCGTPSGLDRHHIVGRGMGGSRRPLVHSEANLITLCRRCHHNLHEGDWELELSPGTLRVIDRRTQEEVMQRFHDPDFDSSSFLHLLNVMNGALDEAVGLIPFLDDAQLVEAFRASRALGKRSWVLQAAILYDAQRRSIYGNRSLEAIARRFEISLRQAQKYALVWRIFFAADRSGDERGDTKSVNVDAFSLDEPSWYVVAATESPEPQRWLAYAQDKKAEHPRYSLSDFRQEIHQAVGATALALEATPADIAAPAVRIPWDCPWVRPYCTRSGRPIPAEECRCEEEADSTERKSTGLRVRD